jgi:hypothetical protein
MFYELPFVTSDCEANTWQAYAEFERRLVERSRARADGEDHDNDGRVRQDDVCA